MPADGAQLSFWVDRDTEPVYDFLFVEARTLVGDDWTTLPDDDGQTSTEAGFSCPGWLTLHPFLTASQREAGDQPCTSTGTSGPWNAATGASDGYEQWSVNLADYAGRDVEVAISHASDDVVQAGGMAVDDIEVSTGEGTTSFEDDGDTLDGWTVPGAPAGSPGNDNDWMPATPQQALNPTGAIVDQSLARQPEIIAFLSERFGPYPFKAAGAIVDDSYELEFALENQTRPIYSPWFFSSVESGSSVIVYELTQQWFGDSAAVAQWQHIWLHEGFATYAQ